MFQLDMAQDQPRANPGGQSSSWIRLAVQKCSVRPSFLWPRMEDTIWLFNIAMEHPLYLELLLGKSSINGPFSMAMLNNYARKCQEVPYVP